ncbi:hypothetical protein B6U90_06890 [Thermoplasmatales archaeon ex4484_6]|nr:MAG: hypothetical protein B6U90_06890 [Thermoplasmatales archaeon ex4484_6]RLF65812.1 MAG: hypothetical protein DRN57_08310 [Thermoplasmata archaeon]
MGLDIEPENLRRVRKMLEMTQRELADLSGVSQSLIAKIESGTVEPSYRVMKELDRVLKGKNRSLLDASGVMNRSVMSFEAAVPLEEAMKGLVRNGYSQAPVIEEGRVVGSISETSIVKELEDGKNTEGLTVRDAMEGPLPQIPASSSLDAARGLLGYFPAVLVMENGGIKGIITKSDLIKDHLVKG